MNYSDLVPLEMRIMRSRKWARYCRTLHTTGVACKDLLNEYQWLIEAAARTLLRLYKTRSQ